MSWCCRVPGKAVLMGEYAVTDGLSAYALAVDRCAEISLTPCSSDQASLRAPQVWPDPIRFRIHDNRVIDWDSGGDGWPRISWTAGLIDRLVEVLKPERLTPFRLTIDTSSLFIEHRGQRSKLGLGSSSAIAVGLFRVLAEHLARHESVAPNELLQILLPIYQDAQQGQGSGIDLATAIHGGMIEFSNQTGKTTTRSFERPEGLLLDFAWTGRPASTPALLARYRQWQRARPDQAADWHRTAAGLLGQGAAALTRGDADELVRLLAEYGRRMSTMGRSMGVDLTPDKHKKIMQRAEGLGLAAKPSGAGVGDLAVIAGTCVEAMEEMRRWLQVEDIARVEMSLAANGARCEGVRRKMPDSD